MDDTPTAIGETLLAHLTSHELDRIPDLFEPEANLLALLPGGLLVGESTTDVGEMFHEWLGDVDEYEVLDASIDRVGPKLVARWRVRLRADRFGPTPRIIEQHAYAELGA